MQTLGYVERRIVAAKDRLLLAKCRFACGEVVVENGARRNKRLIFVAQVRLIKFGIGTEGGIISGLGKWDAK